MKQMNILKHHFGLSQMAKECYISFVFFCLESIIMLSLEKGVLVIMLMSL